VGGISLLSRSAAETQELARRLAARLGGGDVVALAGPLGAGKTCFVQGLCRGLEVAGRVKSPSFALINEYRGRLPVYHFDLYRLAAAEAADIGGEEYLYGPGVSVVEWADRAPGLLPPEHLWVEMAMVPGRETERLIRLLPRGAHFVAAVDGLGGTNDGEGRRRT
jgi:tRNA threonylcarbamoyladenosine biosynthesis protein TsaE